jgi:hypothetical protein
MYASNTASIALSTLFSLSHSDTKWYQNIINKAVAAEDIIIFELLLISLASFFFFKVSLFLLPSKCIH